MPGKVIPLSLGGFYFSPATAPANKVLKQAEFFETVRRCLRGIEGVGSIEIQPDSHQDTIEYDAERAKEYGEYIGPHWDFPRIAFSLYIPLEAQEALDGRIGAYAGGAENFRVHMRYGWLTPASCVETLDPAYEADTSGSAVCVYRYLTQEIERSAENLQLLAMRPIFAYGDFFLEPGAIDSGDGDFQLVSHDIPNFNRYRYAYDTGRIEAEDVADLFLDAVGTELDIFYQTIEAGHVLMRDWHAISETIEALTTLRGQRWYQGFFVRRARYRRLINDATIGLVEFAAKNQTLKGDLHRQVSKTYRDGRGIYMRQVVEDQLSDLADYPVEQFSQLVEMFETQRLTDRELVAVVAASLIGGFVGAAATLIAGG